jgi:hypothetical protein
MPVLGDTRRFPTLTCSGHKGAAVGYDEISQDDPGRRGAISSCHGIAPCSSKAEQRERRGRAINALTYVNADEMSVWHFEMAAMRGERS